MPVLTDALGLEATGEPREITARQTLAYAAGLDETDLRYFDDARADGIVAPPPYCVSLEWPLAVALRDASALGLTTAERLANVHASQETVFHRPIRPGDRLRTDARIVELDAIRPGTKAVTKFVTVDCDSGEPVVTSWSTGIYRGVALDGPGGQLEHGAEPPPAPETDRTTTDIYIPPTLPHTYTECADIWNPIHTERAVALASGLPDIILHGTATWALASREIVRAHADGNGTRLRALGGRFSGMVLPDTTITLHMSRAKTADGLVHFDVRNPDGRPVLSTGVAEIAA
jgi:acyl dehydratase